MLEKAIEALTEAVNANTEMMKAMVARATGNIAAKAAQPEAKVPEAAKPAKTTKAAKTAKPVTPAELKKLATEFLDVTDEDEYANRRALIKAIATYFNAEKLSDVKDEADLADYKLLIETAMAGENVDPDDIDGALASLKDGTPVAKKRSSRDEDL